MESSDKTTIKKMGDELSGEEKAKIMRDIFYNEKDPEKYVRNPEAYLENQFTRLNGFDFRWSSLITSNPLLFEDVDYLRVRDYVDSRITDEERDAYERGECRDLYATLENLLVCNLKYYDRIMNFCTMVFLHYVRVDGEIVTDHLDELPLIISMTPTEIWCAALSGMSSTEWEINHGWSFFGRKWTIKPLMNSPKTVFEMSWKQLYKNRYFKYFVEYAALRCGTSGFRQTFIRDITSNLKLSNVCQKFTKASLAITDQQLETLWDYTREIEAVNTKLYYSLERCLLKIFSNDKSQFAIYVYQDEFYIHTSKFSIRVKKGEKGMLSKDYLANSFECFAAEEHLIPSTREQIEWAKYTVPTRHDYDREMLVSLLHNMLQNDYHDIVCLKRMNDYGVLSKITFSGIFSNVYLQEDFMTDNRVIKTSRLCLSKYNAACYIIDRGYFLFGRNEDVYKFVAKENITPDTLIDHYSNYAIPVMQYMFDIIAEHVNYKNDIIDVVMSNGDINPAKLNNDNIRYTSLVKVDSKQLMNDILTKQNKSIDGKKSYWRVINDEE